MNLKISTSNLTTICNMLFIVWASNNLSVQLSSPCHALSATLYRYSKCSMTTSCFHYGYTTKPTRRENEVDSRRLRIRLRFRLRTLFSKRRIWYSFKSYKRSTNPQGSFEKDSTVVLHMSSIPFTVVLFIPCAKLKPISTHRNVQMT